MIAFLFSTFFFLSSGGAWWGLPVDNNCGLGWTELNPGNVSQPSEVPMAGNVCQGFLLTVHPVGFVRGRDIGCFLMASIVISMFYIMLLQRSSTGYQSKEIPTILVTSSFKCCQKWFSNDLFLWRYLWPAASAMFFSKLHSLSVLFYLQHPSRGWCSLHRYVLSLYRGLRLCSSYLCLWSDVA